MEAKLTFSQFIQENDKLSFFCNIVIEKEKRNFWKINIVNRDKQIVSIFSLECLHYPYFCCL